MKKMIIVPNYLKKESIEFAEVIARYMRSNGYAPIIAEETAKPYKDVEFAVVLGGDGTLLRACKKMYGLNIPVFGINFGHMGYLTECNPETAIQSLEKIIKGEYRTEKRMMIEGKVIRDKKQIYSFVALNESTLYRAKLMKAFCMKILINGKHTQTISGDGVIVATPTGSTSYNLSAGGPVITPTSENMVITPIASKYFPNTSLVIGGNDEIDIITTIGGIYEHGSCACLEIDADDSLDIYDGDIINIKRAANYAEIIKVTERSFYQLLQEKLSKSNFNN